MANNANDLSWAHPLVREWFLAKFGSATEPQTLGWPHILAGRTTLISAPTGSGKTLAAFLACIDALVCKATSGQLKNELSVVYVSPLKALSNDIQKNLDAPLSEIRALAEKNGVEMADIRTAVRTGDTLAPERQRMLRKPPHILVTTPESFYILLTAEKSRKLLESVQTVIVDEIHAIADDKRGAHLAISLERLERLATSHPNRIGLSATQKPIELVAEFLRGGSTQSPVVVNVGHKRDLDLAIELPGAPLGPVASNDLWGEGFDRLADLVKEHRSTLIFVNTRKQAERISMHLAQRLGADAVAAHHGSLSRQLRLSAEKRLKNGEIRALVATASLELGIDIGFVDLVCQINTCRTIATALQRIGRAGHWRGAIPKGRLFPLTRDQLVETAALVYAIKCGDLDRLSVPDSPLDVLAQQIVAIAAAEEIPEEDLFNLVRRAYPYRHLDRRDFDQILNMLSEGISARRGRYGAYLMRDQVHGIVKGRRGARLVAITNGGAIPESNLYSVVAQPDMQPIGTLDEDFAVESHKGDVILLGNTSWRIRRIEYAAGRVFVENAHGAAPSLPFWLGEAPSRSAELSSYVSSLREKIDKLTINVSADFNAHSPQTPEIAAAIAWLEENCGVNQSGAEQLIEYIVQGRAGLGAVPTNSQIIAERFFDEGGGMQLIIHSPFGSRINKAWGLALRKKFCRSFNFELQAAATEDGISIALAEQHSFPLGDVFYYVSKEGVKHTLEQASLQAPVFGTRWRWDATRSLQLLRFMGGKKVPPNLQRLRSDDLLASVFPDAAACQDNIPGDVELPDHPLVNEVMKDILTEAMDLEGLCQLLDGIAGGKIKCLAVDTPTPSQFSHEILNANPYAYLDDAPLEERRARAVEMRRMLPQAVVKEIGRLDEAAITRVLEEAIPDIRDEDELHDLMQTLVYLPENVWPFATANAQTWIEHFQKLVRDSRAARSQLGENFVWVNTERIEQLKLIFPDARILADVPFIACALVEREQAILQMIRGWMQMIGPTTASALHELLSVPIRDLEIALLQLESQGSILRGKFTARSLDQNGTNGSGTSETIEGCIEWCDRRLLARIHQITMATLRKQIDPVSAGLYARWLAHWQHVAPGTQLSGERGILEIIKQLQGFELAANAWESQILPRRISKYNPDNLDKLCLTGAIGWGRLSPHPALSALRPVNGVALVSGNAQVNPQANPQAKAQVNPTVSPIYKYLGSERRVGTGLGISSEIGTSSVLFEEPRVYKAQGAIRRVVPSSVAPVTFFVREDSDWIHARPRAGLHVDLSVLSHAAQTVHKFLKERGASFFQDISRGAGLLKSEIENALWELVTAGLVTADGFDNLRSLIDPKRRAGQSGGRGSSPRNTAGRWSLIFSDHPVERARSIEGLCRVLLHRYGVVFRDVVQRESNLPQWRELLAAFRLLEDRGEVRGGRFVHGFIGEQFALPEAVESLRAMRNRAPSEATATVSATDPLNLVGIILPGERTTALSNTSIQISC